jgi:FMN-dependent NADH-azoreductase
LCVRQDARHLVPHAQAFDGRFGFIGFTDIRETFVEPTEANPTSKDEAVAAASHKAAEMAAHF